MSQQEWNPGVEVRCVHATECGGCPLLPLPYDDQRATKARLLAAAVDRYRLPLAPSLEPMERPHLLSGYRRRARLVVSRSAEGRALVGLFRRHDNLVVVDIPSCQVMSPALLGFVAELRALASAPPPELAPLLLAAGPDGSGVLSGLDVRELLAPEDLQTGEGGGGRMLTLTLAAERAEPVEVLREAARALRQRFPDLHSVAAELRLTGRPSSSSEHVLLSGVSERRDVIDDAAAEPTYQLVSHQSFVHVHRGQASALYRTLAARVAEVGSGPQNVLDLYGGTGAIALSLARDGHRTTLVESHPISGALAARAAQSQRLSVDVVSGEVASVAKALAAARASIDVVIANPPRRGLSPAAREAIAALRPKRVLYVACEFENLSRDLDHFARLGYRARALHPMDMLPLTDEVDVIAVLEAATPAVPEVLHQDAGLMVLAKPPHEPVNLQSEYPSSLIERASGAIDGGTWEPVWTIDPGVSGVCLFARDAATAKRWRDALERTGRFVYLAAVRGMTPTKGAITRELRSDDEAVQARTRYRRLAVGGGHSILRVVPERPVPHQVRRHLAAIGHPVLGDMRYGHAPTNRYFEEKHGLDRSFLHLVRVEVDHPDSGERLIVEAPLSADLRAVLARAADETVLAYLDQKSALGIAGGRVMGRDGDPSSERISSIPAESTPDGLAAAYRSGPVSIRGRTPIDFDEAPRTVRGELVSGDEPDEA